jgi:predicted Zn-dependent protease
VAGAVILLVTALAVLGWRVASRRAIATASIPPPPALPASRADLLDELNARERAARRFLHPAAGLARLARLYHANGYYNEAMSCYAGLRRLEPREARWPHLQASILTEFGRLEEALPLREQTIDLAPQYLPARLRLGDVLLKLNRVTDATHAYEQALALEPSDAYARLGLARCALAAKDWPRAAGQLRLALQSHPDFVGALSLLATVSERLGDQAAATAARGAVGSREFSDLPDAWLDSLMDDCFDAYRLSVASAVAGAAGDVDKAAQRLQRAIELAPNAGAYRRQYAQLLTRQGNTGEARTQLTKAVAATPDDADSWLLLVQNLSGDDPAAAERTLLAGLAACPQSPSLHLERARLLNRAGRGPEAIAEYRESCRLRPNEPAPFVELATVLFANQRVGEAKAALLAALEKQPDHPIALATLALVAISEGDAATATAWWNRLRPASAPPQVLNSVRQSYAQRFGRNLD